jgi:hypothetical protein
MLKFDSNGNFVWRTVFNSSFYGGGVLMTMVVTPEGEPYVCDRYNSSEYHLMKLDTTTGAILWQRPLTLPHGGEKFLWLQFSDANGDLFGLGYVVRDRINHRVLTKIDKEGSQKWLFEAPGPWGAGRNWTSAIGAVPDNNGHLYSSWLGLLVKLKLLAVRSEGDVNGDGCVDDADLAQVIFAFGRRDRDSDVNDDRIVDETDLFTVAEYFGLRCGE